MTRVVCKAGGCDAMVQERAGTFRIMTLGSGYQQNAYKESDAKVGNNG
jgi:hypothetical protein